MLLHEFDTLAQTGWPLSNADLVPVVAVSTLWDEPPADAKKVVLRVKDETQFLAARTDLFYDDTPDPSKSASKKFKAFASGSGPFPPLGSETNFKAGRATNGFLKKGQQILVAPAFIKWASDNGVSPLDTYRGKLPVDYRAEKIKAYRVPVLGKSESGWVVLGVLNKPAAATEGIDWDRSIAVTKLFPAREAQGDGAVLPLLQKASGSGRNAFGAEETDTESERVRLLGARTAASPEQLTRTFDAVMSRLSYWVKAGPQPESARLLFFPVEGQAESLAKLLDAQRPRKKGEEAPAIDRNALAVDRLVANIYLAYGTGSQAGAKLCASRRFHRINIIHWELIEAFFRKTWLESRIVGLQGAGMLGYLKEGGEPDVKKAMQTPSCTQLWTEVLCRSIAGQSIDNLWQTVWRLFAVEAKTVCGRDLEGNSTRPYSKGLLARQIERIIPALSALDDYLTACATRPDDLAAVMREGINPNKTMTASNTDALVDPGLWADLGAYYQRIIERLHAVIIPGHTEAQQRPILHGIAVGLCLTALTQELADNHRSATRTAGLHPSHLRGGRLVDIARGALDQLEVISQRKPARTRHLGKHIIAAATASKADLFNLGLILALSETSISNKP